MRRPSALIAKVILVFSIVACAAAAVSIWDYRAFGLSRMWNLQQGGFLDQFYFLYIPVSKSYKVSGFEAYFRDTGSIAGTPMLQVYSRSILQPARGGNMQLMYFAIRLRDCGALKNMESRRQF